MQQEPDRHKQVMDAVDQAELEHGRDGEAVFADVLAVIPGLTERDLIDHITIDMLLLRPRGTRH